MQMDELREEVDRLIEQVATQSEETPPIRDEMQENQPIQEGEFTEPVEGEVIENPPKPRGVPMQWLLPVGLGSLTLALAVVLVVFPLLAQSATVIITPDRQTVHTQGEITLAAKTVLTKSLTLSEQVQTTGTAHQDATAAHGLVTFYNALQSPQVVPAGALLIGADGVHVVTDQDASLPAATPPQEGYISVPAHAVLTGIGGNIQAGDISGACCRENVFAHNTPFTGGQDARDYKTATNGDVTTASKDMASLITAQLTTEAQKKVAAQETILPPRCQTLATSTPKPGIEAVQTTVSLTSTCTVYAYNRADFTNQEQTLFTQAVNDQLGSGYLLDGRVQETIGDTQIQKNQLVVVVQLSGSCLYHFRSDEIRNIQQLIVDKSRDQATMLLLHVRGIHTVGIQIANGRTAIPNNTNNIVVSVYEK